MHMACSSIMNQQQLVLVLRDGMLIVNCVLSIDLKRMLTAGCFEETRLALLILSSYDHHKL